MMNPISQAKRFNAFTLIELLIVVAIIAILAAIAVPNFLEAQTRAKISRCKNDMRTIVVGLESYHVDSNKYPYPVVASTSGWDAGFMPYIYELSTPIAYLTTVNHKDPFGGKNLWYHWGSGPWTGFLAALDIPLSYYNYNGWYTLRSPVDKPHEGYMLKGNGPDRYPQYPDSGFFVVGKTPLEWADNYDLTRCIGEYYDPTNGTVSKGDLVRYGGDMPGAPNIN